MHMARKKHKVGDLVLSVDTENEKIPFVFGIIRKYDGMSYFVDWCIENFTNNSLKNTHWRNDWIKGLDSGAIIGRGGFEKFDRNKHEQEK